MLRLDHEEAETSGAWREWNLFVLITLGFEAGRAEDDPIGYCFGLVVTPIGSEQSRMKRVGWILLPTKEAARMRNDEGCWKTVTLM